MLRRRIQRLLRSDADADDIVQEAFLRAYENAGEVRVPGAFVYSAARNLALDRRRADKTAQKAALQTVSLAIVDTSVKPVEERVLSEERSRLLTEAVECLPPQCRTVFVLKVFNDQSYKEIADALGISVKTVENHFARGLKETHRHLRQRYEDSGGRND